MARTRWRLPILCTALAAMSAPVTADAGGFHITILGGRRTGMLTNMAAPDDVTALFHNPAGLADQSGKRFHLSGSVAFLNTEFNLQALDPERFPAINPEGPGCNDMDQSQCPWPITGDGYNADAQLNGYYQQEIEPVSTFGILPYIGYSQDLSSFDPEWKDVVFSMAITAPNLYGANLPGDAPTRYYFLEGYFATITPMAGLGWRVNDKLSLGFNVGYNYMQLRYSQDFSTTDLLLPTDAEPTALDRATANAAQRRIGDISIDYTGVDHGVQGTFGVLYEPTDWMALGASVTVATAAKFTGDVDVTAAGNNTLGDTFSPSELEEAVAGQGLKLPRELEVEMVIPPSLQFGTNFIVNTQLEIGLDARFWLYQLADDQVIRPIYGEGEGREPLTQEDLTKPKDYSVSYEVAVGGLYRPLANTPELELMAGVGYDKSPIPNRNFSIDNPSLDQIVASGGLRWFSDSGMRFSATYMHLRYIERDVKDSTGDPPLNVRGRGTNHMPRLEFEYLF